jgi:hypothetical protein
MSNSRLHLNMQSVKTLLTKTNHDVGPDGLLIGQDEHLAIDVTVNHQSQLAWKYDATSRAADKIAKYAELAHKFQWRVLPLVFTTAGHPTKVAMDNIRTLVKGGTKGAARRALVATTIANVRAMTTIARLLTAAMMPVQIGPHLPLY